MIYKNKVLKLLKNKLKCLMKNKNYDKIYLVIQMLKDNQNLKDS